MSQLRSRYEIASGTLAPEHRLPAVYLTKREFRDLPEYSCSIPTGVIIGKRWKCNRNAFRNQDQGPVWVMGEYYDMADPELTGIRWSRIVVRDE